MSLIKCPECGKEISSTVNKCIGCGYEFSKNVQIITSEQANDDTTSVGLCILGFLIPIVGFIIWCVLVNSKPNRAKAVGIASIIGFVINLILITG